MGPARDDDDDGDNSVFGLGAALFPMLGATQLKVRGRGAVVAARFRSLCSAVTAAGAFSADRNRGHSQEPYVSATVYSYKEHL